MICKSENGKLIYLKQKNFEQEKGLQNFVESNMESIIGYSFLKTEFVVEDYRFDSVAFDDENDSFVIVEYKRGKNESLVDQGYAYLKTLINRKADFVLLYNEKRNQNRNKNDFDWSQSKIVFVSPQFTQYQIDATSFGNMPFELYEVKRYENELYDIDRINNIKKISSKLMPNLETETMRQVNSEIRTYDEEYHLKDKSEITRELYNELKSIILDVGPELIPSYKKNYIGFKKDVKHNVFSLWLKNDWIEVCLCAKQGELIDDERLTYNISNRKWSAFQYAFKFNKKTNVDYVISIMRQVYKKCI